ncbi:MAG TPA: GH116 family glycosyl hydrolase, partial [Tepidisphaeraceae bacterium]|nr:GH116 family glycosyl hydrolase [Tepidisphaeraceae bacterium]
QMRLSAKEDVTIKGRLVGSRADHIVDVALDIPSTGVTLKLEPVILPTPAGIDANTWAMARRGWWNAIEPSAQWGDQSRKFSAPAGILANNVVSDPVSCLIHLWADQILLTPEFDKDIHLADLVRRTIDWWIDHRTKPTGEVYAYWDHADMLDANASPLMAAWDYVEASRDRTWLSQRIEKLEFIADYLVKRDLDGDGLIESTHSGNYGTLVEPMRAGSAWDTINAGYKDAYCNVLIYRALRCMADLEAQLKRPEKQAIYKEQADKLKASYVKTFFNPKTGWLAWWISKDGEMHDISAPMITNLAICYGLVEPKQGREMLDRLWAKIEAVGFKRFDLGIPITLAPIRRGDYLMGLEGAGVPKTEDGSDTFQQYLNGGCMVSDAVHFITALHIVGEGDRGDRVLNAMLERQHKGVFPNGGGFQNGVVNEFPKGAEFYTWDGQTTGYEGHLTYSFGFLQAIFLRDPAYRARLLRPVQ